MSEKERGTFKEAQDHAAAALKESMATVKNVLPEAFWEHARASKREATLTVSILRRAVGRKIGGYPDDPPKPDVEVE